MINSRGDGYQYLVGDTSLGTMASNAEILESASQLSVLNAHLTQEIASLAEGRDGLENRFQTTLFHLNKAITKLPVVIHVLTLERPPVSSAVPTRPLHQYCH